MRLLVAFLVHTDQHREHSCQQHEDQSLDQTDEQFHEINGTGNNQPSPGTRLLIASRMFSPAKMLPKRRKLNETGRNRIENTSRNPTRKKMTINRSLSAPVDSPFGPNK